MLNHLASTLESYSKQLGAPQNLAFKIREIEGATEQIQLETLIAKYTEQLSMVMPSAPLKMTACLKQLMEEAERLQVIDLMGALVNSVKMQKIKCGLRVLESTLKFSKTK